MTSDQDALALDKLKALYFDWTKLNGSMDERAYSVRDTLDDLARTLLPDLIPVIEAADDLVSALWNLEWTEDMVVGPKLRTFQDRRALLNARPEGVGEGQSIEVTLRLSREALAQLRRGVQGWVWLQGEEGGEWQLTIEREPPH